jgi:hypothetical protein
LHHPGATNDTSTTNSTSSRPRNISSDNCPGYTSVSSSQSPTETVALRALTLNPFRGSTKGVPMGGSFSPEGRRKVMMMIKGSQAAQWKDLCCHQDAPGNAGAKDAGKEVEWKRRQ